MQPERKILKRLLTLVLMFKIITEALNIHLHGEVLVHVGARMEVCTTHLWLFFFQVALQEQIILSQHTVNKAVALASTNYTSSVQFASPKNEHPSMRQ